VWYRAFFYYFLEMFYHSPRMSGLSGSVNLKELLNYPLVVFASSLVVLWLALRLGILIRRLQPVPEDERDDLSVVTSASLTLLALIIGFTFSMAVSRYDQRKNHEEEEANAIGTEYVRAGLLPAADGSRVRELLTRYLDQRLLFHTVRDPRHLEQIDRETARLQTELWLTVQSVASVHPDPVTALVLSGMNDVLNRQGYTQASWSNRIPVGAWSLMVVLAICSSILLGYAVRRRAESLLGSNRSRSCVVQHLDRRNFRWP
jgi:hypothetical protein